MASLTGPRSNQRSRAVSMLTATHWNGTGRSSMRWPGDCSSIRVRSRLLECRWVRERASVRI